MLLQSVSVSLQPYRVCIVTERKTNLTPKEKAIDRWNIQHALQSPAARCNTQIYHWGAVEGVCMYDLLWKPSQREKYAICKYLVKQMCDCPLMDEVV